MFYVFFSLQQALKDVSSIYMDDGVTETEAFKTLRDLIQCEALQYDLSRAKLVSVFCPAPPFMLSMCLTLHMATTMISWLQLVAIGLCFNWLQFIVYVFVSFICFCRFSCLHVLVRITFCTGST